MAKATVSGAQDDAPQGRYSCRPREPTERDAKDATERRYASEDMCCLRTAILVEKEVGKGLGSGQDVLGTLQANFAAQTPRSFLTMTARA